MSLRRCRAHIFQNRSLKYGRTFMLCCSISDVDSAFRIVHLCVHPDFKGDHKTAAAPAAET